MGGGSRYCFRLCKARALVLNSAQRSVRREMARVCTWVSWRNFLTVSERKYSATNANTSRASEKAGRRAFRSAHVLAVLAFVLQRKAYLLQIMWCNKQNNNLPLLTLPVPWLSVSTPPCSHVRFVGQRKEIALLDLEESSNSEFGSVELR